MNSAKGGETVLVLGTRGLEAVSSGVLGLQVFCQELLGFGVGEEGVEGEIELPSKLHPR